MNQNIFFTSDTHFYHANILKFCPNTRGGAKDKDEMNELLISAWNAQVEPEDIVWHLGDFSFGPPEKTEKILQRLNGRIRLIRGNHDYDNVIAHNKKYFQSIDYYVEKKIHGQNFVLFHYPIKEWNKCHRGSIHLYGHVHGRKVDVGGKSMDVGIDTRPGFQLYTFEEIIKIMEKKDVIKHH